MKKLLTLLLASLLLLCPVLPSLAFTSDGDDNSDNPIRINLYLADYDEQDFFGIASLPPADRGYAKNEIVAAVAELYIPSKAVIQNSTFRARYQWISFSGENADLYVTENNISENAEGGLTAELITGNIPDVPIDTLFSEADNAIRIRLNWIQLSNEGETYRWLFFAKVTGENASLTFTLYDGSDGTEDGFSLPKPIDEDGGTVQTLSRYLHELSLKIGKLKSPDIEGWRYQVLTIADDDIHGNIKGFTIYVDDDNRSTGMELISETWTVALGVNTNNEIGIMDPLNPAVLLTSGDLYDSFMEYYNDIVVGRLGLDYLKLGNYVRDSYFENLASEYTLTVTADIEPFTPYVSIPQSIALNPPKTDGGPCLMGITLVVLSCAAMLLKQKCR